MDPILRQQAPLVFAPPQPVVRYVDSSSSSESSSSSDSEYDAADDANQPAHVRDPRPRNRDARRAAIFAHNQRIFLAHYRWQTPHLPNLSYGNVQKIWAYTRENRGNAPRYPLQLLVCTEYVKEILERTLGDGPELIRFYHNPPIPQPPPFNQYPIAHPMKLYTTRDTDPLLRRLAMDGYNLRRQQPQADDIFPTMQNAPIFTRALLPDQEWLNECLPPRLRHIQARNRFFRELPAVPGDAPAVFGNFFNLFMIAFPTDIMFSTWVNTELYRGTARQLHVVNILEIIHAWLLYKVVDHGIESFLEHRLNPVHLQQTLTRNQYETRTHTLTFSQHDLLSREYANLRLTDLSHEILMKHVHAFNSMYSLHSSSVLGPCTRGTIDENDRPWYGEPDKPFGPANKRQCKDKVYQESTQTREFYCNCHHFSLSRFAIPPAGGYPLFYQQNENKASLSGVPWRGMSMPTLQVVTLLRLTGRSHRWRHIYADAAFGSFELALYLKKNGIDCTCIIKSNFAGSGRYLSKPAGVPERGHKKETMALGFNNGFIMTREASDEVVQKHLNAVAALRQAAQDENPPRALETPPHPYIPLVDADLANLAQYDVLPNPNPTFRIFETFIQHSVLRHMITTAPYFDTCHYITTTKKRELLPHNNMQPHPLVGTETFKEDADYSTNFHVVDESNREQHQLGVNDIQVKQYRRAFFIEIISLAVHNAYRMYIHRPARLQQQGVNLSFQQFQLQLLDDMHTYITTHPHCSFVPQPAQPQPAPPAQQPVAPGQPPQMPPVPQTFITLFTRLQGDPLKFRAGSAGHSHASGHPFQCACKQAEVKWGCKSCSHHNPHMAFCAPCYFEHIRSHENGQLAEVACNRQCRDQ